ncbi:MAG: Lrp/AsnC family transcriptional regulator [Desulfosarcina sp.]|nr:Lrp/AsnC family transcriptional regulator [Desulfobacterales bacterium]
MLDAISIQILKILQRKARIPNVEVARQIGMAPSAVLERIRKLENQGFIDGYEVCLNPSRFNCRLVVFAVVQPRSVAEIDSIGDRLAGLSAVQEVHFVSGEDAFLIKIRVAGTEALNHLIRDVISRIEGVQSIRSHIVLSTIKETSHIPIDQDAEEE